MHDYILLMHDDAGETAGADRQAAWGRYLETLGKSGRFLGGSAVGGGRCYAASGVTKEITAHITGYLRVQAASLEEARKFLEGNPVFEAGGTVEIRELPAS